MDSIIILIFWATTYLSFTVFKTSLDKEETKFKDSSQRKFIIFVSGLTLFLLTAGSVMATLLHILG